MLTAAEQSVGQLTLLAVRRCVDGSSLVTTALCSAQLHLTLHPAACAPNTGQPPDLGPALDPSFAPNLHSILEPRWTSRLEIHTHSRLVKPQTASAPAVGPSRKIAPSWHTIWHRRATSSRSTAVSAPRPSSPRSAASASLQAVGGMEWN